MVRFARARHSNWYICTTMVASAPNTTRPRGAARREALLDAVLQVVAEEGVDAVTHRRVADVAGLPLASTTYWFESKEHLLMAALERAAERDIERLQAFIGEDPSALPTRSGGRSARFSARSRTRALRRRRRLAPGDLRADARGRAPAGAA